MTKLPLGTAEFTCDTLGVNPGTWTFHCHILTHAEGHSGMYGMVTALVVQG